MKTQIKKIGLLSLLGLLFIECTPSSPTTCSTTSSDFQTIFSTVLSSNSLYDDYTTMDLVTHEYTFTMYADKDICQIGYQGNSALSSATNPYTIEIWDTSITGAPIYTENKSFGSSGTDYYTPSSTVHLLNGHSYTIKRKVNNYLGNIANTTGRICRYNSGGLPTSGDLTSGAMEITSSNFYGTGGPIPNYGIPYIDIIFQ